MAYRGRGGNARGGGRFSKGGHSALSSKERAKENIYGPASSSSGPSSGAEMFKAHLAMLRAQQREADQSFDARSGYERYDSGPPRIGYLFNILPCTLNGEDRLSRSALDLYFLQQDGDTFKATVEFEPYFYVVLASHATERELISALERKFEGLVSKISAVDREDLEMPNHLAGHKRRLILLTFRSSEELMKVRSQLRPIVEKNAMAMARGDDLEDEAATSGDPFRLLCDMREYDVPYQTRAAIDKDVRVGSWYEMTPAPLREGEDGLKGCCTARKLGEDFEGVPAPRILAWDIECTKAPLKFPDARIDQVYMISYMLDGIGFLLINREIVTQDVPSFEYSPSDEYKGPFTVTNCRNEEAMLRAFIDHCKEVRPQIYVTYNGDFFDWPFVNARCAQYGINLKEEIGMSSTDPAGENPGGPFAGNNNSSSGSGSNGGAQNGGAGAGNGGGDGGGGGGAGSGPPKSPGDNGPGGEKEWRGRTAVHIDCLYWVKRDSFLPQGSHGLKNVTRERLGYDPVEIDPEDMLTMARDNPLHMASYSVSDAVATYYLYMKYCHAFIFSLCTIIPMGPDDVLRKGSGTLCEMLLMVEAFNKGILCPNKQKEAVGRTFNGHLLETETYLGGHVECLESGVFRNDIPIQWKLIPSAFDELIANIDKALTFAIEVENGEQRADIANYDEVRSTIIERLELLRDKPVREEAPVIYHLDVAAMYPNIILSNRLQPCAMVTEDVCGGCDYNTVADARCKRHMKWKWRGEYYPAKGEEVATIKAQLSTEDVDGVPYTDLPHVDQAALLKKRLKTYSSMVYKRVKDTVEAERTATVCQRENPFYVDTVRAFRDRRYDYKILTKKWSKELAAAEKKGSKLDIEFAKARVVLFDSLQLAHKCILNSFYGYVMRKGARWHSMEMAGVVTLTGSTLIQQARRLVEQVGRPLELDTDGIWCVLPASFPQRFSFTKRGGGKVDIMYPCVMLNADVHANYTNHQYQELIDPATKSYKIRSECSIFFELDGPYAAMVLPASQEEGRLLKKRYAVFEEDGTLAELKGFELKRRGELKMIKVFQQQVFDHFLDGDSLLSCYAAVGSIADWWLNMLDTQGEDFTDDEIVEYLSENRSMTKTLDEYGDQKSVAISTAKRLSEFLGAETVKDKGLNCKLLVSKKPAGAPVTERAIPTTIFSADPKVRRHFIRKWCKDSGMRDADMEIRALLDWDYYRTRLSAAIQKIITIPAALQRIPNPVPRVAHPEWLYKMIASKNATHKQTTLNAFLTARPAMAVNLLPPAPPSATPGGAGAAAGVHATPLKQLHAGSGGIEASGVSPLLFDSQQQQQHKPSSSSAAAAGGGGAAFDIEDGVGGGSGSGNQHRHSSDGSSSGSNANRKKPAVHINKWLTENNSNSSSGGSGDGAAAGSKDAGPAAEVLDVEAAADAAAAAPPAPVAAAAPAIPEAPPLSTTMDKDEVAAWLASRKAMWRRMRRERRQRNAAIAGGADGAGGAGAKSGKGGKVKAGKGGVDAAAAGVAGMSLSSGGAAAAAAAAAVPKPLQPTVGHGPGYGYLQVIDVRPDPRTPGEFILWAFTSPRRVQQLRMRLTRTMYINRRSPMGADDNRARFSQQVTNKRLPHDAVPQYLYEFSISEQRYQKAARWIGGSMDDHEVLGVYETRTPLLFRLLMNLGCVTQIAPHRRHALLAQARGQSSSTAAASGSASGSGTMGSPSRGVGSGGIGVSNTGKLTLGGGGAGRSPATKRGAGGKGKHNAGAAETKKQSTLGAMVSKQQQQQQAVKQPEVVVGEDGQMYLEDAPPDAAPAASPGLPPVQAEAEAAAAAAAASIPPVAAESDAAAAVAPASPSQHAGRLEELLDLDDGDLVQPQVQQHQHQQGDTLQADAAADDAANNADFDDAAAPASPSKRDTSASGAVGGAAAVAVPTQHQDSEDLLAAMLQDEADGNAGAEPGAGSASAVGTIEAVPASPTASAAAPSTDAAGGTGAASSPTSPAGPPSPMDLAIAAIKTGAGAAAVDQPAPGAGAGAAKTAPKRKRLLQADVLAQARQAQVDAEAAAAGAGSSGGKGKGKGGRGGAAGGGILAYTRVMVPGQVGMDGGAGTAGAGSAGGVAGYNAELQLAADLGLIDGDDGSGGNGNGNGTAGEGIKSKKAKGASTARDDAKLFFGPSSNSSSTFSAASSLSLSSVRFTPSDLTLLTTATSPYLDPCPIDIGHGPRVGGMQPAGSAVYRRAFLYHSSSLPSTSSSSASASNAAGGANGGANASLLHQLGLSSQSSPAGKAATGTIAGVRGVTILFLVNETCSQLSDTYATALIENMRAEGAIHPTKPLDDTTRQLVHAQAAAMIPGYHVPVTITAHVFVVAPLSSTNAPAAAAGKKGKGKDAHHHHPQQQIEVNQNDRLPKSTLARRFTEATQSQGMHPSNAIDVKVVQLDRQADAWKRVSLVLSELTPQSSSRNPPIILNSCSPLPATALSRLIPSASSVPIVPCQWDPSDGSYPALNWTDVAASKALVSFLRSFSWWHSRLDLARYCQIPVGNLSDLQDGFAASSGIGVVGNDAIVLHHSSNSSSGTDKSNDIDLSTGIADLMFARMLTYNNHLLWLSPSAIPDLGGMEADDAVALYSSRRGGTGNEMPIVVSASGNKGGSSSSSLASASAASATNNGGEPLSNPVVHNPGVYRGVCVTLAMHYLDVNTVLNSDYLPGMSDIGMMMAMAAAAAQDGVGGDGDDAAASAAAGADGADGAARRVTASSGSCIHAFRALKLMLSNWYADARATGNQYATDLLRRMYSWLSSSSSLLHDPALHGMLHGLMTRAFDVLLKALRQAGLTVIHASFESIIVSTGKQSMGAASAHVRHALNKVTSQPLFRNLLLVPTQYWHTLLFLDSANMCGLSGGREAEALLAAQSQSQAQGGPSSSASLPAPQAEQLDDAWADRIVNATIEVVSSTGAPLTKKDWRTLRDAYIRDVSSDYSSQHKWAMADYLPPNAINVFTVAAESFIKKPLLTRAQRNFERMKSHFIASVESAIVQAVILRSGPALLLVNSITGASSDDDDGTGRAAGRKRRAGGGDDDDDDDEVVEVEDEDGGKRRGSDSEHGDDDDEEAQLSDVDEHRAGVPASTPAATPGPSSSPLSPTTPSTPGGLSTARLDRSTVRALIRSITREEEAAEAAEDAGFVRKLVAEDLSNKMVHAVQTLEEAGRDHHHTAQRAESAALLAVTTGRDRSSLEFVKLTCHVLALDADPAVKAAVLSLRATLLNLLRVRESDAVWSDPCVSYTLPDVVCKHCNTCRDVDLLRDPHRRATLTSTGDEDEQHQDGSDAYENDDGRSHARHPSEAAAVYRHDWHCPGCDNAYDRDELEDSLIEVVQARSMAHQTQDLKCVKCKRIRSAVARKSCACSGVFAAIESASHFKASMGVFKSISTVFAFPALHEAVHAILTGQ